MVQKISQFAGSSLKGWANILFHQAIPVCWKNGVQKNLGSFHFCWNQQRPLKKGIKAIILSAIFFFFIPPLLHATSPQKAENYHFLVITDTHVGVKHKMDIAPSGYDAQNDLDDATFFKLLKKIKSLLQQKSIKPQSILILGDLVDHPDGNVLTGSYAGRKEQ